MADLKQDDSLYQAMQKALRRMRESEMAQEQCHNEALKQMLQSHIPIGENGEINEGCKAGNRRAAQD